MKKVFPVTALFFLTIALTACSNGSANQTAIPVDLTEYHYKYFDSVRQASITTESWDSAFQIRPDYLVDFFGNATGLNRLSTDSDPAAVSGDLVESYIQLYFAVDSDYIRQATYYNSNQNTYELSIPSGGAAATKVVAVSENGDIISLSYEYYDPADDITVIREGTLAIQVLGPVEYHYISCDMTDLR